MGFLAINFLQKEREKPAAFPRYLLSEFCRVIQSIAVTQFHNEPLHRHIAASYKSDNFTKSLIEIFAGGQTPGGDRLYQGTADAVRQNLGFFLERPYEYYRHGYGDLLHQHVRTGADVTLGTTRSTGRRLWAVGFC